MRKLFPVIFLFFAGLAAQAQVAQAGHVVVVLEENHSYSSVIGNPAMPYLNSLASQNTLATQYYADTHPSIGNYFMMTTGQIITNDDSFMSTISADNIVRHLLSAGKTWKSYAENLPAAGYTGGDAYPYVRHHNPFSYFSDVANSSVQKYNLVPFTQFAADLNNNQLPEFSYIIPNMLDDGHDGSLNQSDAWLQSHIAPLLSNPTFQKDGLLIIVYDESFDTDTAAGGGHIAMVMAGPLVKKGYKSTSFYQHQSLLKTALQALGVGSYPGAAASAPAMADAFGSGSPTPTPTPTPSPSGCSATSGVKICAPVSGSTVGSPVQFVAAAASGAPITAMRIYIDGVSAYTGSTSSLNTSLPVAAGTHNVIIQAWDTTGAVVKSSVTINVGTPSPNPPPTACQAATTGVTVCSPAQGTATSSPVHFLAAAASGHPISAMRIYIDGVSAYTTSVASINTSLQVASGTHSVIVQAWDSSGAVFKNAQTITVQ